MPRLMFPYRKKDGGWSDTPEPRESEPDQPEKQRRPQGFFTAHDPQRAAQENRSGKTFLVRCWLEAALYNTPLPARTVLKLAREEGINEWSLRRAKKHHGIRSIRVGGAAWKGSWVWQLPQDTGEINLSRICSLFAKAGERE